MSNFVPQAAHINSKARAGFFYVRPPTSGPVTVARIAQVAAQNTSGISTANMVRAIADSPWNKSHFEYSKTGTQNYTNYGFPGPQYAKRSGSFPPLWIPTAAGAEPEQVYGGGMVVRKPGPAPSPTRAGAGPGDRSGTGTGTRDDYLTSGGRTTTGSGGAGRGGTGAGGAGGGFFSTAGGFPWGWIIAGGGLAVAGAIAWRMTRKKRR